ncbi:hypothetical protein [Halalkalibacter oceani]|uniref:hypothetical protein n=1 Tax=Halalkalibacter oceani TaxID=1653776 RepID=UPI003397256C
MPVLSKLKYGTELRIKKNFKVRIREDVVRIWEETFPEGTKVIFGSYSRARERPPDMCQKEEFFTCDEMELGRLEPAKVTVFIAGELYELPKDTFLEFFEILGEEEDESEILRS